MEGEGADGVGVGQGWDERGGDEGGCLFAL
jgi:hypothetical protein